MKRFAFWLVVVPFLSLVGNLAVAGVDATLTGTVVDTDQVAVEGANVSVIDAHGETVRKVKTSQVGAFTFFPINFGDYTVLVESSAFPAYRTQVHVGSGGTANVDVVLTKAGASKEMVIKVSAKRKLVQAKESRSSVEISHEQIQNLPQSDQIKLPKLIATTTPGVVSGAFGQLFIRGNHANIQYQIDGVQLPESPSNTFGEAFTPRNIDHMEVITGGIPAEYGQRLGAVVNIISKTGSETPGGTAELNYGSYNTFSPTATYGGSNASGNLHYYFSANYNRTDRGLDTPQPASPLNLTQSGSLDQGGTDAIHDSAHGHTEFAKIDWIADNQNKLSFILFNNYSFFQIPTYPSSFNPKDPFFDPGFTDPKYGAGPFNWTPANTDDSQAESNAYAMTVWKHTFSERSFLQVAPYYKYSYINVNNDPSNDLNAVIGQIPTAEPSSFSEARGVHNVGVKTDYTLRVNDSHLVKTGVQFQYSKSFGNISVGNQNSTTQANINDTGYTEGIYLQDDFTIIKPLVLSAGLRFDAVQFTFGGTSSSESALQPRVGLSYMIDDKTKVHGFYGRLFQPASIENLRKQIDDSQLPNKVVLQDYSINSEKDNYFEVGVARELPAEQVIEVNAYYKSSTDMLDDAQLLNTSIAQPYNYATGYAYGLEASVHGNITPEITHYVNYSYEIAKGKGLTGGFSGLTGSADYQFLDHVQIHTLNAGLTYRKNHFWATSQFLFGSGLRTGEDNSKSLPSHFTMDATVGYEFTGDSWWTQFKVSADVLNIFNNVYPVTIANGFNGSHYAAGRTFFVHLVKNF